MLSFADLVTKIRIVWNKALGTIEKPVLKQDDMLLMILLQLGNNLKVSIKIKPSKIFPSIIQQVILNGGTEEFSYPLFNFFCGNQLFENIKSKLLA